MTSLDIESSSMTSLPFSDVTAAWDDEGVTQFWNDNETASPNVTDSVCVMCKYYLDPWVKAIRVAFGSCIVLANIGTFTLLLRSRNLQMAMRVFLLNVSVVDGVYGAGFLYHSAVVDFPQFIVMNLECKMRYGILCMVSMVALFTLMAMCVDRVIALKFPFYYPRLVTKRILSVGIFFFWAIPFAIVTPTYILMDSSVGECNFVRFISDESFVVFAVTYFSFMLIAVLCQLFLLAITKTHIRKIIPTLLSEQREKAALKMNLKAISTTLALAVPFVICATPKVLTYMYLAFNPRERIKVESITLLAVTVYLNVSNSLINPMVYCWRLSEMRQQIMSIFRRKLTSPLTSSEPDGIPVGSSSSSTNEKGNKEHADYDSIKKGFPEKEKATDSGNPESLESSKVYPDADNDKTDAPLSIDCAQENDKSCNKEQEKKAMNHESTKTSQFTPFKPGNELDPSGGYTANTGTRNDGYFGGTMSYNLADDHQASVRRYESNGNLEPPVVETNAWGLII